MSSTSVMYESSLRCSLGCLGYTRQEGFRCNEQVQPFKREELQGSSLGVSFEKLDRFSTRLLISHRTGGLENSPSTLTIRNVKGNRFMTAEESAKELVYSINLPRTADSISLLIVHRLLVMAIRRRLLVGISTIEEFFEQTGREIQIKKEFLNNLILMSGGPRGLGITDSLTTAGALTEHLSR